MEVIFGAPIHKTNTSAITSESKDRLTGTSNQQTKKMESKKRGVYVEKWTNEKQIRIEDNKRQPRMKVKPKARPVTNKLLTTTPAESKIAAFTRLLGTADPAVRFKKRKTPKVTPTPKMSKQNSKISNTTSKSQPKSEIKPLRNIVEENKKNVKNTKFRSNVLREVYSKMSEKTISYKSRREIVQTPSNCSRVTRDISDHAHWSNIFPSDRQNNNTVGKNLLQQYICNYEQGGNTLNENITNTDKKYTTTGKQEPMHDFFIDLLESVYDEELPNTDDGTIQFDSSPKISDVKFEIDDNVVQKLYMLQDSNGDDANETPNQNRQLADYYNRGKRLVPPKRRRRRKAAKNFHYIPEYAKAEDERKKRRKPNLLTILKQQLSMDYTQQEPDNMYDALLTIAKQKRRKRQQVYIDTSTKEPSEPDGVCRFRRRNVISPSTRMPRMQRQTKGYSMNATKNRYKSDTMTNEKDSSHSIEVFGFDYDESMNLGVESDPEEVLVGARNIVNLNEGITTVTQYWKR